MAHTHKTQIKIATNHILFYYICRRPKKCKFVKIMAHNHKTQIKIAAHHILFYCICRSPKKCKPTSPALASNNALVKVKAAMCLKEEETWGVDTAADAARVPAIGAPNPIANDLGGPNPVPAANDAVQQLTTVITTLVLIFLVGFVEGHQKPIVNELVSILVKEPHDEVNIFSYVTCFCVL